MKNRNAFTLIELLVVIAIIAILAAILFPVFAQAKDAAKKAVCLSHCKETGLGIHLYLSDNEERMPMSHLFFNNTNVQAYVPIPPAWLDSAAGISAAQKEAYRYFWVNAIYPFTKSYSIFRCPSAKRDREKMGWPGSLIRPPQDVKNYGTYTMNDLLHTYPASAITSPSKVPLVVEHTDLMRGYANPAVYRMCAGLAGACIYQPATPNCSAARPGETSDAVGGLQWLHGRGQTNVYTDTHAKYVRRGIQLNPADTNPDVDPYTHYTGKYNEVVDGIQLSEPGQAARVWGDNKGDTPVSVTLLQIQAKGSVACHPYTMKPDTSR